MASDRQQFKRARVKWESLLADRKLSVAPDVGVTAIIVSGSVNAKKDTPEAVVERRIFYDEAERLEAAVVQQGGTPQVFAATASNFGTVLQNPEVSSVYTIGHGNLTHLALEDAKAYFWSTAAAAADHLKTGVFVQRQCGNLGRGGLNVPLGLFCVEDPRNLHAATGVQLPDELDESHEDYFKPVFATPTVDLRDIRMLGTKTMILEGAGS